ncbi:SGF29 tudor-like domain containing protein [Aphelenchoides avenae]|nr:SGF29 tudor-like domain containing protein [Aphelenchus avenae]
MPKRRAIREPSESSASQSRTPSGKRAESQEPEKEQVRERLLNIQHQMPKLVNKNEKVNEALKSVNAMIRTSQTLTAESKQRLVGKYETLIKLARGELKSVNESLGLIYQVNQLRFDLQMSETLARGDLMHVLAMHAKTLPLWIGDVTGHPPPLVGAIPLPEKEPVEEEAYVAAFIDDIWILAQVLKQLPNGKYELRDVDPDEKPGTHASRNPVVSRSRIEPLPNYRANPKEHGHALFPRDAMVLALYPQTTCFYAGVVERAPETATENYSVAFDDPSYPEGLSPPLEVPQRFVIAHKDVGGAVSPSGKNKKGGRLRKSDFVLR